MPPFKRERREARADYNKKDEQFLSSSSLGIGIKRSLCFFTVRLLFCCGWLIFYNLLPKPGTWCWRWSLEKDKSNSKLCRRNLVSDTGMSWGSKAGHGLRAMMCVLLDGGSQRSFITETLLQKYTANVWAKRNWPWNFLAVSRPNETSPKC